MTVLSWSALAKKAWRGQNRSIARHYFGHFGRQIGKFQAGTIWSMDYFNECSWSVYS
jgi:hypothetical protein